MANATTIQARIDSNTKEAAKGILAALGISMSEAISMYFRQIVLQQGIPFEIKLPNEITVKTFENTDAGKDLHKVSSLKELMRDLQT
jgi:DNA-damage-inducible protein J